MAADTTTARCPACGFHPADWDERDTANTFAVADILRAMWSERLGDAGAPPSSTSATVAAGDVHAFWHELQALAVVRREQYAASGATPPVPGSVVQVSASDGGVPKRSIEHAEVGWRGVVGDVQRARQHHGRPWQALCLWSADVIDALVAEGHPIFPGAAGENLTVRGIDWAALHAGDVLDIGEVRCQLSAAAVPCTKNNQWFADHDSRRIHYERHPGWSRWYASVLRPGRVAVGDPVVVLR